MAEGKIRKLGETWIQIYKYTVIITGFEIFMYICIEGEPPGNRHRLCQTDRDRQTHKTEEKGSPQRPAGATLGSRADRQ